MTLGGQLKALDLKVKAAYAAVAAASESGTLSALESYTISTDFSLNKKIPDNSMASPYASAVATEYVNASYTLPVISIRSTFDEYIKHAK